MNYHPALRNVLPKGIPKSGIKRFCESFVFMINVKSIDLICINSAQ